jgi:hypothetical protein
VRPHRSHADDTSHRTQPELKREAVYLHIHPRRRAEDGETKNELYRLQTKLPEGEHRDEPRRVGAGRADAEGRKDGHFGATSDAEGRNISQKLRSSNSTAAA